MDKIIKYKGYDIMRYSLASERCIIGTNRGYWCDFDLDSPKTAFYVIDRHISFSFLEAEFNKLNSDLPYSSLLKKPLTEDLIMDAIVQANYEEIVSKLDNEES